MSRQDYMGDNRPLFTLTVSEFAELMNAHQLTEKAPEQKEPDEYIYGIAGLASFLRVSKTHAQNLKSQKLKGTYTQIGRKIIFNKKSVLQTLKKQSNEVQNR